MNSVPHVARDTFKTLLEDRLRDLLQQRPRSPRPGLLSISLNAGGLGMNMAAKLTDGDFYWSHPGEGLRLYARGTAWSEREQGAERLTRLADRFNGALPDWNQLEADGQCARPRMFTALAFDPCDGMDDEWRGFPNSCLVLPELLLEQTPDGAGLVFSCRNGLLDVQRQVRHWMELVEPLFERDEPEPTAPRLKSGATSPPREHWLDLSREAIDDFVDNLDKLVLYRSLKLTGDSPLSTRLLMNRMESAYPDCRLFAARIGDAVMVSASPERLLSRRGNRLVCDALAGTAPRSQDPRQDEKLARELRASEKDRWEHLLVHQALEAALGPVCSDLSSHLEPGLKRLQNVQHLWNEVSGTLRGEINPLEIAHRLHPTPAVNGSPPAPALEWLRRQGQARRGWYSGAGGWIGRDGDAELAVLLRCALVRGNELRLFAGAGLVKGSEPEAELAETELKLQAVLGLIDEPIHDAANGRHA